MSLDPANVTPTPASTAPARAPAQAQARANRFLRRPVLTGAAAIAAVGAAFGAGQILSPHAVVAQQIRAEPPRAAASLPSFADLVDRVAPAVVSLDVVSQSSGSPSRGELDALPPQWRRFFEQLPEQRGRPREQRGGGSGFFISATGHIVTNNHVVEDAREITATLKDGRELKATVVGRDERTDLAVLKVEGSNFPYVQFAPEARVRVGDWVVAIGNPFGLGGTATAGIVSALGRDRVGDGSNISDFIQVDAPINPGNSGGPTFDMSGRVIGVNTAIFSRTGGNIGIGFAVPATTADRVSKQIIQAGRVTYGWLGVTIQDLNREMAESFGLGDAKGALVGAVTAGSPAARAGLKRGDAILSINGQRLEGSADLTRRVGQTSVGDVVRLEVANAGNQRRTVNVTIAARPPEAQLAQADGGQGGAIPGEPGAAQPGPLGLTVGPLTATARARLNLGAADAGVLVLNVDEDSVASDRGLTAGDAILEVNGQPVRSSGDFAAAVQAAERAGRTSVGVFVQRQNGASGFVPLPIKPATPSKAK
jgi:serine protease Do